MATEVRRLNKRFVTILTIGVMVVLTVVIGVMIVATTHKDPELYGKRGDDFMKAGNYIEAGKNYSLAYRYSKKNPQWLIKIAESQYQQGETGRALGSLQGAVTADATLVDARKRLVEIYYEMGGRTPPPAFAKTMEDEADKLIKMIPEKQAGGATKKTLAMAYHVRGVARNARRSEDSQLEKLAQEDLNKAILLDSNPEYVESLATMSMTGAQQMARLAASANITPESYDEYIKNMGEKIAEAESHYLSLAKQSQTSESLIALGNFYFQMWGNLEKAMSGFCTSHVEQIQNTIQQANRQLESLEAEKQGTADDRRRTRQRVSNQISQLKREIPEWKVRAKKHNDQFQACSKKALEYFNGAMKLAQTSEQRVEAQMSLSRYYVVYGDPVKAESLILQAIRENPQGYLPYRLLAMIDRQIASQLKADAGRAKMEEAIKAVEHRVNDLPHDFKGIKGRTNRYQLVDLKAILTEIYVDSQKGEDLAKADKLLADMST